MTQIIESCKQFKEQYSNIFWNLPSQYCWIFGMATGIFFMFLTTPDNAFFNDYPVADQIAFFTLGSFLIGMLFTGAIIIAVACIVFFVILGPIIRDTAKEVKMVFVDYPKVMKEGVINEKTTETVKDYLGIVITEKLDKIREVLRKETKEEISNTVNPANIAYQKHDKLLKDLNENKVDKSDLAKVEKTFMDEYRKVNLKFQEERKLRIQAEQERDKLLRKFKIERQEKEELKMVNNEKLQTISDTVHSTNNSENSFIQKNNQFEEDL